MSNAEWRPKVGERVVIYATVPREGTADGRVCVQLPCGGHHWFALGNLTPLGLAVRAELQRMEARDD